MKKVLQNKNIVLTRARNQSLETIGQLKDLGANVISFPTIKINTITKDPILDETIKNIHKYNTIIFTSENAVKSLLEKINELNVIFDPKAFFVISIGDKTSQSCIENGFRIDFQSTFASSDSLLKELGYIDLVGRKILIPSSTLSKENQFTSLEDHGAEITSMPIYKNTPNNSDTLKDEIHLINNVNIDLFIFTSPSTFKGFLEIIDIKDPKKYFNNKNIAVIGPITKKALNKAGIEPNIVPQNFTMNYLIKEIKKFFSKVKVTD